MAESIAPEIVSGKVGGMLTGNQIAAARRLAGFPSRGALAKAADVSLQTVNRAEGAGHSAPSLGGDQMARIVLALEEAGVEFTLPSGRSLVGGLVLGRRA